MGWREIRKNEESVSDKLHSSFTALCYKKEQRNGGSSRRAIRGEGRISFSQDERFYAGKNEPVKRGKSIMQERGDNWRCDVRDQERGAGIAYKWRERP